MRVDDAQDLLAELPEDLRLHILAGGYVPESALVGGDLSLVLAEAPEQASLVVTAHPADVVEVDGAPVPLQDGTLIATVPIAELTVTVTGGGRVETHELSPASGYALWLRTSEPDPLRVQFPVNSSTLQAAQRAQIQTIAENVSGWSLQVQGGASPEGDPVRNLALANARGEAVAAALIEAGLPADRLTYLPAQAPAESDEDFEWLRFATITPIEEAP
ncbi:MAG: OmpA family protein [Proteobacteria bacterium]|nr:OmpA family protein [Pseudomonadota bacterium]